jgi:hypothetical protein
VIITRYTLLKAFSAVAKVDLAPLNSLLNHSAFPTCLFQPKLIVFTMPHCLAEE